MANIVVIQGTSNASTGSSPSKKDANGPQITPLEKHLLEAGPIREDGSDKFWGLENVRLLHILALRMRADRLLCFQFGNTWYANIDLSSRKAGSADFLKLLQFHSTVSLLLSTFPRTGH